MNIKRSIIIITGIIIIVQKIPGEAKLLDIPTKKNGENIKKKAASTTKLIQKFMMGLLGQN